MAKAVAQYFLHFDDENEWEKPTDIERSDKVELN